MEIRDKDVTGWFKGFLKRDAGPCPDEEFLASYLDGCIPVKDKDSVARHVLSCERCRTAISAATVEIPRRVRVPVRLERKAVELVPSANSVWEIIVKSVEGMIKVLKNTGDNARYFVTVHEFARGGPDIPGKGLSLVALNRRFAGIDAEVEIERIAPGLSDIKITARNTDTGNRPNDLRVNLRLSKGDEIMSYVLQGGSATFDKIQHGTYRIDFTRRGIRLGEIALEIKGE